jgi:xanthine dehydrogenase large subunit
MRAPTACRPPTRLKSSRWRASPPTRAAGRSTPHESARAQVAGGATYVDDIPEVRGTLHAAPILSTVAHGKLLGVDTARRWPCRRARRDPGADIPGDPVLGNFSHDEPVFARDTCSTSARSSAWWWPTP